jgi:hypothetical protein
VVVTEMQPAPASKRATIARRSPSEAELTDSTATPLWLANMLPEVDLDPCSCVRSHIRARKRYDGAELGDGLALPWIGTVFQNNPFSRPLPWMLKLRRELAYSRCTGAIVLCKDDCSTAWWRVLTGYDRECKLDMMPVEMWRFHRRVQYDEHPDVIEARRIERVRERIEKWAKRGKVVPDEKLARIHGKSQANFTSVIVHHRGAKLAPMPPLALESVATRWVMA